jgi:hypothetical protein
LPGDVLVSRKARFAAWLQDRFFLRFHMALILALAFAAGLAVTKLFLVAGNVRRAEREGWVPATIRATALPFAFMLVAAVGFGAAATELCPEARRMADVVACARS